jgi:flagellar FliJ protein
MPKFIFRLEGALRQRKNVEEQRKRELAEWQTQMEVLDAELRALDASVRATEQDLRANRLIGPLDLSFLAAHRRYAFSMQRKALVIAERMAGIQNSLNEARRNLIEAAKQRKIVERLRERQQLRWKEALDKSELAAMDEVGMQLAFQQNIDDRAIALEQPIASDRAVETNRAGVS